MALYTIPVKTKLVGEKTATLILVNPVSISIKIRQIDVSLDNSGAQAGVQFEILRGPMVTGAGEGTFSTFVPVLADERDAAATSTVRILYTVEQTWAPTVIASYYVQPLGGLLPLPFPYGSEIIGKKAGNALGLRYTTQVGVTPDVVAQIWVEE